MLVGYEEPRRTLQQARQRAMAGNGGAIVVVGEAGAGKSMLCDDMASQSAPDALVLRTQGTEIASDVPFLALHDVLSPLQDRLERLPGPQCRALMAALALAPGAPGDPLAVSLATLNLLAAADRPLVMLVDDVMWIDPSSAKVLDFVARRIEALPVLVMFTTRTDAEHTLWGGLPALHLPGLDLAAAGELLRNVSPAVVPEVVVRLWERTGGNPLALVEVARLVSSTALAGREPLPDQLPLGERLQAHFGDRLKELPERTRTALAVVAACRSGRWDVLTPALHAGGLGPDDLDPAEAAGLVEVTHEGARPRHPLVRSAAYHAAASSVRRQAHGWLADAGPATDLDEHAWHLAAAATGVDDTAAAALRATAARALNRGGFAEAATALERAAILSGEASERLACRLDAARFWHAAGYPWRALGVLDTAATESTSDQDRCLVYEVRGGIELWLGHPRPARDRLAMEADRVAEALPAVAARLRVQASMPSIMLGEVVRAEELAAQAWDVLHADDGVFGPLAAGAYAEALLLRGDQRRGSELVERAATSLPAFPLERHVLPLGFLVLHGLGLAQLVEDAMSLASRLVEYARANGAPALLAAPLTTLADLQGRRGDLRAAVANATEAVEICSAVGHTTEHGHALAVLARTQAVMGHPDAERNATESIAMATKTGAESLQAYANHALGLVALTAGDAASALTYLEDVSRLMKRHGVLNAYVVPWEPDAVEAYVMEGRWAEAAAITARLEAHAASTATAWDRAVALRCRGLLGRDDAIASLEEALATLGPDENPYEAARASLSLGEALRRRRQRAMARDHLRRAVALFERCGAEPWAARAGEELRVAGGRAAGRRAPRRLPTSATLTDQELRIAMRVAAGDTNREVAAALYLSHKTVENRLTDIYAKVGVRSRTELAAALQSSASSPP